MVKTIFKYIITFLVTIILLVSLYTIVTMIPKSSIKSNLNESIDYINNSTSSPDNKAIRRDFLADTMILNIIASHNSSKPLNSLLYSKYYINEDELRTDKSDLEIIVNEDVKAKNQYLRYWHGSIVWVKPLLTIFNYQQILIINAIIMGVLFFILAYLVYKKYPLLSVLLGVSFICTYSFFVPASLEYTWTYLIALITSIIAVLIEKKGDSKLFMLFFISGILTNFFDFLTTETIVVLLPLTLVILIRYKEKRLTNFKDGFILCLKSMVLFGVAYIITWLSKIILASIVLNINAFDYSLSSAKYRMYGRAALTMTEQVFGAVFNNCSLILPFSLFGNAKVVIFIIFIFIISSFFFLYRKKSKQLWISKLLFLMGLVPIIRFLVISNHSYIHAFFTYRALLPSIILFFFAFIYGIDKKLIRRKK